MTLETLLGPAVPATYLVLLGLEALRPARAWPRSASGACWAARSSW